MSNQTSFLKLNAVFDTGVSRSLSWRRKQLQGIHDLVQNNSEPLVKAALRDSRLTRAEVLLELASVLELVRSEIDGIKKYSKSSAAFKSSVRSSVDSVHQRVASRQLPAGVIVVKSSWSHPYSSVLGAAALAYAAGNVVAYAISDKAVASTLAPLFSTNLDQSGYELLDLSTFDKAHAHILDAVSPSVSLLEVANDGSVYAASVATPLPKSCVVYVHTSGNVKAAAWAIAASKAAFNGQAPLAPTVAFVDNAVYEEFRFELLTALRNTPYRKTSSGGVLSAQGVDVLAQEPCFVVEAPST
ncbi:Aldehyde/histidinol dehydrogenase [Crucibulum laeve]|uniref:Aldehyde/histidinol dehydrogenase n=1 Tax=Crucibulum laeve TaxID=68775 RepID=A0A5C3LWL3_9AGAR|nr:Aldehyde/histidinol dehydrogenase [Crucibulum laeve]